jgi:uncharacterized membrane protein YdjX (TVP38/TMEM64 family)
MSDIKADKKTKILRWLLGLTVAGICAVFIILFFDKILWLFDVDKKEQLKDWIESFGIMSYLVFVFIQFLQVVVFIIPGEIVQIMGGFLYHPLVGGLLSLVGIGLGSLFNFLLARFLGRPFIHKILKEKTVERFDHLLQNPRSQMVFFLFFLIPGIPKDVLCYMGGLSVISTGEFMAVSMVARIPALTGSLLMGNALRLNQWGMLLGIGIVAAVLFMFGFIYYKRIHDFLINLSVKAKDKKNVLNQGPKESSPEVKRTRPSNPEEK